jgi:hypothetical protein
MFAGLCTRRYARHETYRIMKNFDIKMTTGVIYSDLKRELLLSKNIIRYSHLLLSIQRYTKLVCLTNHNKSLETYYVPVLTELHNSKNICHGNPNIYLCRNYNTMSMEDIPAVSESQIRKALKSHGVNFVDGFTCLVIECPVCLQNDKRRTGRMYINKVTGKVLYETEKFYILQEPVTWPHPEMLNLVYIQSYQPPMRYCPTFS